MGTGTVSILAGRFYFGRGTVVLEIVMLSFFFLNLALYTIFLLASMARYIMFKGVS